MTDGTSSEVLKLYAPGISDDALWAIVRNATRHLLDADEHFKKGRHASAISSAVLSIEEWGKLLSVALMGKPMFKGVQSHRGHQMLFIALLRLISSLPSPWGLVAKEGLAADAPLSPAQDRDVNAHPEFREFVDALRAGQLNDRQQRIEAWTRATAAKESRDGTTAKWMPLIDGYFHKLRLKATYVDVGADGNVLSDPSGVDAETAEFLCMGAYGMLVVGSVFVIAPRLTAHHQEFIALVPDDLTGASLVNRVVEAFKSAGAASKAA